MAASLELDWHGLSNEEVGALWKVQRGNIILQRTTNTDVTVTHDPSEEVYTAGDVVGLGKELLALIVEGIVLGTGHINSTVQ